MLHKKTIFLFSLEVIVHQQPLQCPVFWSSMLGSCSKVPIPQGALKPSVRDKMLSVITEGYSWGGTRGLHIPPTAKWDSSTISTGVCETMLTSGMCKCCKNWPSCPLLALYGAFSGGKSCDVHERRWQCMHRGCHWEPWRHLASGSTRSWQHNFMINP